MVLVAGGAGALFGLALAMLSAFFVTKDERFDHVAEWAFIAFAALAVPTILATGGRVGGDGTLVGALTAVGVLSVVVIGLAELGTALRLVDFRRIAGSVTLAFLGFLAWVGAVSGLVIAGGGLPVGLGWLGLASIAAGVALVLLIIRTPGVLSGDRDPGTGAMAVFFVPMVGIVAWMIWLGLSL